jgi:hypothetical protein
MKAVVSERRCPRCEEVKPASEFFRNSRQAHGLAVYCKRCEREKAQTPAGKLKKAREDRLYRERHKAQLAVTKARWLKENPARRKVISRRYSERHREEKARRSAAWIAANLERHRKRKREYMNRWYWANHERVLATAQRAGERRRAHRAGAAGFATRAQIEARVAYYGWRCWMCGAPWRDLDHVIPLSRGGSHWPAEPAASVPLLQFRQAGSDAKRHQM